MSSTLFLAADHYLAIRPQIGSREVALTHTIQRFGITDRPALERAIQVLQLSRSMVSV